MAWRQKNSGAKAFLKAMMEKKNLCCMDAACKENKLICSGSKLVNIGEGKY